MGEGESDSSVRTSANSETSGFALVTARAVRAIAQLSGVVSQRWGTVPKTDVLEASYNDVVEFIELVNDNFVKRGLWPASDSELPAIVDEETIEEVECE